MPRTRLAVAIAMAFPLAAAAQVKTLPTVEINAKRDSYRAEASDAVLRDAVPLVQVPQSVIVLNRKLLDDQDARTMQEAVSNASSVQAPDPRDQFNTQYKIRGFNAATVIDGVAMPSLFSNLESTVAIESLEVIKGPGTLLNSGGQSAGAFGFVGGALAVTTKSPVDQPLRSIGVRGGSRGERGIWIDLNQPVNDALAVRLVAERHRMATATSGVDLERTALFPSLSLRTGRDSELTLKVRVTRQTTQDYSGLPPEGTVVAAGWSVPAALNVSAAGQPASTSAVDGLTLRWRQTLGKDWSVDVTGYELNSRLDQNGVFTDDFFGVNPGPVYFLSGLNLTQKVKTSGISSTVRGAVRAGDTVHNLAFGVDADKTSDFGYMAFSAGGLGGLGAWDIRTPQSAVWVAPVGNLATAQDNTYRSTSVFLQDRVTVGGKLHLTAALRHSVIKVDNQWPAFLVSSQTTNRATSPRFGAVWEFSPRLSAFVGHGQTATVPTNGIYTTPPRPETARQTEIGLRLRDLAGVHATLALFDLTRRNVPVNDPANFGQSIQSGEQRSSGFDADVQWKPGRDWTVMGHYTRQNPRLTQDTSLPVGNQLFNTFKHASRLAVRYEVPDGPARGLGLGLGVRQHGPMPLNAANTLYTPSVRVWDAQATYLHAGVRYQAAIRNVLNAQFYEPAAYFNGPHVIPSFGRQLSVSATWSF